MEMTGERQVSPTISGIRRDHVARYEFAAAVLPKNVRVLDFGCGIGYGTRIMSDAGIDAVGIDISQEAIDYAKEHYQGIGYTPLYYLADGNNPDHLGMYAASVCFEVIEHIEDPRPLLRALRDAAVTLICSVPNEEVIPWEIRPGVGTAFHHRHYTKFQFNELLRECGWCVTEWYGQLGPESEVEANVHGRTIIAVCTRDVLLESKPEPGSRHIAILGLGPSLDQYLEITKRLGGRSKFCDETWAINALGGVFACDLVFHMDDVRVQEIRAAAAPSSNIAAMLEWLKTSPVPVVTSREHPDYPSLVAFPLEDVLNHFGHDYFNSTAAYAVAFAIHTGATHISLFGMDFTYPNANDAEKGRGCVEFWLGQAHARGIKINLPKTTTLMDAMHDRAARLYGYDCVNVDFKTDADGMVSLTFTDREVMPTAADIEKAYDHSAHPNAIVNKSKKGQST